MNPEMGRPRLGVAVVFGVTASVAACVAILALVGFLANVVVPRSIDEGPIAPHGEALLVDVLVVSLFGVQHSVMARMRFKRSWTRFVPQAHERSTYVFASSLALLLLIWQWRPIPVSIWAVTTPLGRAVLSAVFCAGWLVMIAATLEIDPLELSGLRQAFSHSRGEAVRATAFQVTGLHRLVRHPVYLGWFVVFWATPAMSAGHALFAGLMSTYIVIAIQFEERDLARVHGPAYERYRSQVPMLVPWKGRVHARIPPTSDRGARR